MEICSAGSPEQSVSLALLLLLEAREVAHQLLDRSSCLRCQAGGNGVLCGVDRERHLVGAA